MDEYVGKYRILGEVARGGMGVVYRALDEHLGRDVALKSPLADDASDDDRRRFLQEARAACRVSHPHVVPVYEVFEQGRRPWLAMEFIEGRTLRQTLDHGRLPIEEVLLIGEQMADALAAAHGRGILHRDVKPSNIMMAGRGDARLMDFGLARRTQGLGADAANPTATDLHREIAGTLGYGSPEQILGHAIEASSDVFSLGAVLYEAATGRRAFTGDTPGELFDATLHFTPAPIGDLAREAPGELQRIISKALAKRADERYQSAAELAADLRTMRRRLESQHHTPPVRVDTPARPWRLAAAVGALLLAAGATVLWYETWRAARIELGPPQQLTASAGWQAEPAMSPDGSLVAYSASEGGNADIWLLDIRNGTAVRLTDDPANDRSPAWFPDGSTLAFVSDRGGKTAIWKIPRLGGPPSLVLENAEDPAVSPDGSTLAFSRQDASGFLHISIAPLANPHDVRVLTTEQTGLWHHQRAAWSPDGRTIAYQAARDLWAVSVADARATLLTNADAADTEPVWSADGRFVYFSSNREGARALWRAPAAGGPAVRLTGGQGPERQPSLSRDGTRLVYSTFVNDLDVVIRDLTSGKEQRLASDGNESSPVFAPDGRSVAFVSTRWIGRYDVWLQPIDANGARGDARRLTDQEGSVSQPAFSPDGRWIAYHRTLNGQRDIWVVPTSGASPVQFTADPGIDVEPDWSPDGRQIVFMSDRDGTPQVWAAPVADGRPAGPARRLTSGPPAAGSPTWSPDGTIAYVGADGEAWIIAGVGTTPAHRLTKGADVQRLAWNRASGRLWAIGFWGAGVLSFRVIDIKAGDVRPPSPPVPVLVPKSGFTFDLSWDGQRLAVTRQDLRGHIWMQQVR